MTKVFYNFLFEKQWTAVGTCWWILVVTITGTDKQYLLGIMILIAIIKVALNSTFLIKN